MFRNEFPDEDHASFRGPPHIETDIHFLKALVQRHRESKQACALKLKTNQAEVSHAVEIIQLRSPWDKWFKQSGVNRVIEHQDVFPFSGQKYLLILHPVSMHLAGHNCIWKTLFLRLGAPPVAQQPFQFFLELAHILEVAVDRGEADVGHRVQPLQLLHY